MRLRVKVRAGAGKSRLAGKWGDAWKVDVAAPAVDGKANRALIQFLARTLELPRSAVRIISGERSPHKILALDTQEAEAVRKLESWLR